MMFLLVVVVIAAIVVVAVVVVAAGGGDGVLFVVSAFCDFLASPLVMVRQGVAWFGQPLCVLTGGAPQPLQLSNYSTIVPRLVLPNITCFACWP